MKLVFLLQKNAWFVQHDTSWYRLSEQPCIDLALAVMPLTVADQYEMVEQPHLAGTATVIEGGGADIRVFLLSPDDKKVAEETLKLDLSRLVDVEWLAPPFKDGWVRASTEITLDGVRDYEIETYLPSLDNSHTKVLVVTNLGTGEATEQLLKRSEKTTVSLLKQKAPQRVTLRLECAPEENSAGMDTRELGFILVDDHVRAA